PDEAVSQEVDADEGAAVARANQNAVSICERRGPQATAGILQDRFLVGDERLTPHDVAAVWIEADQAQIVVLFHQRVEFAGQGQRRAPEDAVGPRPAGVPLGGAPFPPAGFRGLATSARAPAVAG